MGLWKALALTSSKGESSGLSTTPAVPAERPTDTRSGRLTSACSTQNGSFSNLYPLLLSQTSSGLSCCINHMLGNDFPQQCSQNPWATKRNDLLRHLHCMGVCGNTGNAAMAHPKRAQHVCVHSVIYSCTAPLIPVTTVIIPLLLEI